MKGRLFLMGKNGCSADEFDEKNHQAAGSRYFEQAGSIPGKRDTRNQGEQAGYWRLGSIHDGGEGHDCQRDVGNIVEK